MSGTAYEVGIHLSAVNNVSGVLAVIGKEVFGLTGSVKKLEESFGRLKLAFVGGLGAAAGMGMFHMMAKTVDHAKELSHELTQIKKLGLDDKQFGEVRRQMQVVPRNVPGMDQVDAGKAYGAMYSMFGHDGALKMMEPLSKFATVLGNTTGKMEGAFDQVYAMVRSGDLMGKFVDEKTHKVDTEKLNSFLDLAGRMTLATHGKVDPQTWLGLAQQGGPALGGMNENGLMTMGIIAQAMGGQRAGTALSSIYSQFMGGIATQRTAEEMKKLGMITDYTTGRGGQVRISDEQKNPEYKAALKTDMVDFVKLLMRDWGKQGKDMDKMVESLYTLFGRQTSQREIHDVLRNMPQIEGERDRAKQAMGIGASADVANKEDLVQVEQNLKKAWKDFQETLGNSQFVIDALNKLTDVIRTMNTFAQENPTAMKVITEGLVALAAALVVVGGGAVLVAAAALAPEAAIGLAIAGIASAIGVLAALNWDAVKAGFESIKTAVMDFIAWVGSIPAMIMNGLKDLGGWLKKNVPYDTDSKTPGLQQYTNPFKKSSFEPPRNNGADTPVQVHAALHVDGEVLARATTYHVARLHEHPTSAPNFDGTRGFMSPDGQFATG